MNILFDIPTQSVSGIAKYIVSTFSFLAAVGGLSMAIVQVLKDLTIVRVAFNRRFLLSWFDRAKLDPSHPKKTQRIFGLKLPQQSGVAVHRSPAFAEAVTLATAGNELALLDLPAEQLCGQLTAGTQVLLDTPSRYPHFFEVLVSAAQPSDVQKFLETRPDSALPAPGSQMDAQEQARVQARIQHTMQRSMDALHISLSARWQWLLQIMSFVCSGIITIVAISNLPGALDTKEKYLMVPIYIIVAGFLAPVARDLVAAVQSYAR